MKLVSYFRRRGDRCDYLYDFGHGWEHEVVLEGEEEHDESFKVACWGARATSRRKTAGAPNSRSRADLPRLSYRAAIRSSEWRASRRGTTEPQPPASMSSTVVITSPSTP